MYSVLKHGLFIGILWGKILFAQNVIWNTDNKVLLDGNFKAESVCDPLPLYTVERVL